MEVGALFENFRKALIALEPYFKVVDIEPRGHDWSEDIVSSMFCGMVNEPMIEKYGKGVYVIELCNYNPSSDYVFISYRIKKGSQVYRSLNNVHGNRKYNNFENVTLDTAIEIDALEDLNNIFVDDPYQQLNYAWGVIHESDSKISYYIAKIEDCEFT